MLVIRLSRVGKTKQSEYRLTIGEKTKDPWGNILEQLGYFNPRTEPPTIDLNKERITYWLNKGAQTSNTVRNLLISEGVIQGEKAKPSGISHKKVEEEKSTGETLPAKEKHEGPVSSETPVEASQQAEEEKAQESNKDKTAV